MIASIQYLWEALELPITKNSFLASNFIEKEV